MVEKNYITVQEEIKRDWDVNQNDYEKELFEMINQDSELEWLTEEYNEEQNFEKFTQRKELKKEKIAFQKKKLKENTQNHLKEIFR